MNTLFELRDLTVTYPTAQAPAVTGIDLSLAPGETLALVGESGSGKSTTAKALAGLLPAAAVSVRTHTILGHDLRGAGDSGWRGLRGSAMGYVPQDAGLGLNPVRTIGSQLGQVVRGGTGRLGRSSTVSEATVASLESVGLTAGHLGRYPHELSGGQRQRVLIALALAGDPKLVIADEPTSALDVTVQKQVLDLLAGLVGSTGAGLVLITHDLGVAADRADRIAVLEQGRVVETGPASRVLQDPQADYTRALVAAAPSVALLRDPTPLRSVAEQADSAAAGAGGGHSAGAEDAVPGGPGGARGRLAAGPGDFAVRASGLVKEFAGRGRSLRAVDGVSLELRRGRTLGLVGESGSGKSTTARILLGLESWDAGRVELLGKELAPPGRRARGARGRTAQDRARAARLVYQDPSASLDPRRTIAQTLEAPLRGFGIGDRRSRRLRVTELLDRVGLPQSFGHRHPGEVSGGQRQRVAIARALAVEPQLLVLDEPVSALDVSVQAQILDLLVGLQREFGLSYVFISHDLAVIRQISDTVAVLADGRLVESGPAAHVFAHPESDVTRRLLDAVPGRGAHLENAA
ncbi:ABC transporter ATP-binding protein [Brevibacterium sp. 91QC2O2]|uniref:dipeptide ABC transporter ATP-binding protein n=1 Tax=Brevibacterium TaxID=1696 RepID=UPI00211BBCD2|nr:MULTISPECIES: ABC transporter ATP-binding protein [unclassified Brevibacterium]MCQ9367825.1 ABC transporter ATP-binding protein [Brevibacterium sp. 91QC2O2]MCQ9384870.1 ABC transporter ATP-binding protein [Brevibacterium sp. 68QC2CO]